MKYKSIVFFIFHFSFFVSSEAQSLSGTITDSANNQTIPGAVVFIPQLKLETATDIKGNYKISPIPKGTYEIEVEILGYATLTKQITINGDKIQNFVLTVSASSEKEVVITSLGNLTDTKRSPVPVTIVTHDAMLQETSTNVVDAISTQPGIDAITTGPGVSKPEINGLGYNRVLTLFDGVRQEDFQWGDEHGILIDPYAVYDAEIIRGPASLQYGANAVAGVVSFKSEPFPENGTIKGSILTEYQTNAGLIGNSEDIGGNNKGFVWDLRASNEESHCYWDPKDTCLADRQGYVWGTAVVQSNARLVLGLNRQWGYTRLTMSALHRQIEIPDGNRDSATRQFEFDVPQGNPQYYQSGALKGQLIPGTGQVFPNNSNYMSYNPDISGYQILDHYVLSWQNSINVGQGRVLGDFGFTQSHRQEIDTGVIAEENMLVNDVPYSIKYQIAGYNSGLKFISGFNGMYETMYNTPPPYPYKADCEIPNYNLFDIGGYAILNKDFKNLSLSGGLRYDSRIIDGQPKYLLYYNTSSQEIVPAGTPNAYEQFPTFNRTFNGFSGSIGATEQLPENNYVKINLAKSFRAPAINELTSNEVNPGGNLYESGDPNLKPESGYQGDVAFGNNGRDVNFEIDGFCNYIQNFIFSDRTDSVAQGKSVFQYKANTAIIMGVAAYFNIHPADTKWIEIDNGFTYIYTYLPNQTDSTQHLPWTPAPRLTTEVKFHLGTIHESFLRNTYLEFGLAKYWAQNDIYSAYYTELPSAAYTLYNAGFGTNFVNHKTGRIICSLFINVTNLTNIAYIDHTSRTQYFWAYNGKNDPTNYGYAPSIVTTPSEGIYNMGRNVGFKLLFPIGGHNLPEAE
jgi:iron complex outermembrane receptor protein